jgi:hypothetical protein
MRLLLLLLLLLLHLLLALLKFLQDLLRGAGSAWGAFGYGHGRPAIDQRRLRRRLLLHVRLVGHIFILRVLSGVICHRLTVVIGIALVACA